MQLCDASAHGVSSNSDDRRGGGGNLTAQRTVVEFARSGPPPRKKARLDDGANGKKVTHISNKEASQPFRPEDPDVIDVDSLFESDELILATGASGSARRDSKPLATDGATTAPLRKEAGEQRSRKSKIQGLDELNTHPFLDLSRLPSANARIKNRMKLKNPFSTARVNSQKPKPKSKQPNTTAFLPIKAWYLGRKLFEKPYHLVWTSSGKMVIRSGDDPNATPAEHSEQIDLSLFAERVFFVEPEETCPDKVFVLKTSEMGKANGHKPIGAQFSSCFKQGGSHGAGEILLKFDGASPAWANAVYAQFVQWLQGIVEKREKLRGKAGEAKWETARRMAELMETRIRRETGGPAPSDVAVRTKSPAAPATNTAKPPSRPRSRRQGTPNTPIEVGSPTRVHSCRQRLSRPADPDAAPQSARPSVAPQQPCVDPDEVILVYPPGQTGAVNITNGDVSRLAPDQLLNDTLVEFGLKLWLQDLGEENPELVKQIHVFSSFFYKKLTEKDNTEGSAQEYLEMGYENVRKWTAKFDLFDKKYIIVPINEDLHWYLAIIYQPEHTLKPPLRPPSTKSPSTRRKTRQQSPEIEFISSKPRPSHSRARRTPSPIETAISAGGPGTLYPNSNMQEEAELAGQLVSSSTDGEPSACGTATKPEACDTDEDFDSLFESDDDGMDVEVVEAAVEQPPTPAGTNDRGPSAWQADPEVMDVDDPDQSMDPLLIGADAETPATRAVLDPVQTTNFYSSAKSRGKRKAELPPLETFPPTQEALLSEISEDEAEEGQPSTYVFTLDSLGIPHDEAVTVLGNYLQLEARGRKGIPLEMSRKAAGKKALVPYQRNNFDCGVYLIHLAQTFISDPEHYYNLITRTTRMNSAKRQIEWRDDQIKTLRRSLTERIGELSLEWKKNRTMPKELGKTVGESVPQSPPHSNSCVVVHEFPGE